jgi:hypothetical protein
MYGAKAAGLPRGEDVLVSIEGAGCHWVGFRKIAANMARHGSALRGLFGERAGEAGAGHRVVIELHGGSWRMRRADVARIKAAGTRVFVDSGAFSEVQLNRPHNGSLPFPDAPPFTWVKAAPIDDTEWRVRLAAMTEIAEQLGAQAYVVAPDRRLSRHQAADRHTQRPRRRAPRADRHT